MCAVRMNWLGYRQESGDPETWAEKFLRCGV